MDQTQLQLGNQICFPIYSASRLITKAYKPHLDKLGLTYPQYLVLLVLWENDGQTVNQISEKLHLNTNTISPLLKRMERIKLLNRNRSKTDERSVIIELTEAGKELHTQALPIPQKLFDEIISNKIQLDDILRLKDTLCELVSVLSYKDFPSEKGEAQLKKKKTIT